MVVIVLISPVVTGTRQGYRCHWVRGRVTTVRNPACRSSPGHQRHGPTRSSRWHPSIEPMNPYGNPPASTRSSSCLCRRRRCRGAPVAPGRSRRGCRMPLLRPGEAVADPAGTFFVGLESKGGPGAPNRDRPARAWAQASKSSHRWLNLSNRANPPATHRRGGAFDIRTRPSSGRRRRISDIASDRG